MILIGSFGKRMIDHPFYFLVGLIVLAVLLSVISWVREQAKSTNE